MAKYVPPYVRTAVSSPIATPSRRETWEESQRRMNAGRERHTTTQPPQRVSEPAPEPMSHSEWLREQQSRYVHAAKTPAQLAAEMDSLTFEQLRKRAGPPPPITGDDYITRTVEGDAGESYLGFTIDIKRFRIGESAPPFPLTGGNDRGDAMELGDIDGGGSGVVVKSHASQMRTAYATWYRQWGDRLTAKWRQEHREPVFVQKKIGTNNRAIKTTAEETMLPRRDVEVSEQSGW